MFVWYDRNLQKNKQNKYILKFFSDSSTGYLRIFTSHCQTFACIIFVGTEFRA